MALNKQEWKDEFDWKLHMLQVQVVKDTLEGYIDGTDESYQLVKEIEDLVNNLLEEI